MKQETNTMQTKEGLHTQGEWKVNNDNIFPEIARAGDLIAVCPSHDVSETAAQANAELIVKAVNERKALLDSHRELLSAMNLVLPILENPKDAAKYLFRVDIFKEAINNAKNIK